MVSDYDAATRLPEEPNSLHRGRFEHIAKVFLTLNSCRNVIKAIMTAHFYRAPKPSPVKHPNYALGNMSRLGVRGPLCMSPNRALGSIR